MLFMNTDYLIERLRLLCRRFSDDELQGRFEVAKRSTLNEQYLYQILAGKSSRNGKPRSVGQNARSKLDRAFPDWLDQPLTDHKPQLDIPTISQRAPRTRALVQSICSLAEQIDDDGLDALIAVATCFLKSHPIKRSHKRKAG